MIFSDGITESARNASVWNGDVERAAERRAPRRCSARLAATTSSSGASESRPATGSGSSASTSRAVDDDDAAADARAAGATARGHRRVVHADDDDVVRVVRDRRGERAALQAEAAHEPEPDPARAEVALDDRDLREVALRVGDRLAVRDASAPRRATR